MVGSVVLIISVSIYREMQEVEMNLLHGEEIFRPNPHRPALQVHRKRHDQPLQHHPSGLAHYCAEKSFEKGFTWTKSEFLNKNEINLN